MKKMRSTYYNRNNDLFLVYQIQDIIRDFQKNPSEEQFHKINELTEKLVNM